MASKVVTPTAYNFLLHINSLFVQRKRGSLPVQVDTVSLRERARLIIEESATITVTEG